MQHLPTSDSSGGLVVAGCDSTGKGCSTKRGKIIIIIIIIYINKNQKIAINS
jgi:hypothetical protein